MGCTSFNRGSRSLPFLSHRWSFELVVWKAETRRWFWDILSARSTFAGKSESFRFRELMSSFNPLIRKMAGGVVVTDDFRRLDASRMSRKPRQRSLKHVDHLRSPRFGRVASGHYVTTRQGRVQTLGLPDRQWGVETWSLAGRTLTTELGGRAGPNQAPLLHTPPSGKSLRHNRHNRHKGSGIVLIYMKMPRNAPPIVLISPCDRKEYHYGSG